MRSEDIYQQLIDLAEKLDVTVTEQNLKLSGFPVKSGLCKIKGRHHIILDKHTTKEGQTDVLIECLRQFSVDDIYLIPAIRDLLTFKSKEGENVFDDDHG